MLASLPAPVQTAAIAHAATLAASENPVKNWPATTIVVHEASFEDLNSPAALTAPPGLLPFVEPDLLWTVTAAAYVNPDLPLLNRSEQSQLPYRTLKRLARTLPESGGPEVFAGWCLACRARHVAAQTGQRLSLRDRRLLHELASCGTEFFDLETCSNVEPVRVSEPTQPQKEKYP